MRIASGALSMSHTRNLSIYNAAVAVEETLTSLSTQLAGADAAEAAAVYAEVAQGVANRAVGALKPLLASMEAALLDGLASMHVKDVRTQMSAGVGMDEDADPSGVEQCSDYMQASLLVLEQVRV